MKSFKLWLMASAIAITSAVAPTQSANGTLQGMVIQEDVGPVFALVTVQDVATLTTVATTFSDLGGFILSLPPGDYIVSTNTFNAAALERVTIASNQTTFVTLVLPSPFFPLPFPLPFPW